MKNIIDFFKNKKRHLIAIALCLGVSVAIVKLYSRPIAEMVTTALDKNSLDKMSTISREMREQYRELMAAQNDVHNSLVDFNEQKNQYELADQAEKQNIARALGITLSDIVTQESNFIEKISLILRSAQVLGVILVGEKNSEDVAAVNKEMEVKKTIDSIAHNATEVSAEYENILSKSP
jgi:hypothetical protein